MPYVYDRIHGEVFLDYEEYRVLGTVEVQALARRRLSGFGYLVNTTATESVLAHAVGSLNLVNRILYASRLAPRLGEDAVRQLRLAALLRPLTAPSHAMAIERGSPVWLDRTLTGAATTLWAKYSHTSPSTGVFLSQILTDEDKTAVLEILSGEGPYYASLVVGPLSAVRMDHVRRAAASFGFVSASFDDAIFGGFAIQMMRAAEREGELAVMLRENDFVLSVAEDIVYSDWYLHRHGYHHPSVMGANAMLARAWELAKDHMGDQDLPHIVGDDEFLRCIAAAGAASGAPSGLREAGELCGRLLSRTLYKPAFALRLNPDVAKSAERKQAREVFARKIRERGEELVWEPRRAFDGQISRAWVLPKDADDIEHTLAESSARSALSPSLERLEARHEAFNDIWVFVSDKSEQASCYAAANEIAHSILRTEIEKQRALHRANPTQPVRWVFTSAFEPGHPPFDDVREEGVRRDVAWFLDEYLSVYLTDAVKRRLAPEARDSPERGSVAEAIGALELAYEFAIAGGRTREEIGELLSLDKNGLTRFLNALETADERTGIEMLSYRRSPGFNEDSRGASRRIYVFDDRVKRTTLIEVVADQRIRLRRTLAALQD